MLKIFVVGGTKEEQTMFKHWLTMIRPGGFVTFKRWSFETPLNVRRAYLKQLKVFEPNDNIECILNCECPDIIRQAQQTPVMVIHLRQKLSWRVPIDLNRHVLFDISASKKVGKWLTRSELAELVEVAQLSLPTKKTKYDLNERAIKR